MARTKIALQPIAVRGPNASAPYRMDTANHEPYSSTELGDLDGTEIQIATPDGSTLTFIDNATGAIMFTITFTGVQSPWRPPA